MRYKALPLSVRVPSGPSGSPVIAAQGKKGRLRRDALLTLLLPALLIPFMAIQAAASLTVNPSTVRPGASVIVHGQGLPAKSHGQLTFDDSKAGMPTYPSTRRAPSP
jgi:hypothetical protein